MSDDDLRFHLHKACRIALSGKEVAGEDVRLVNALRALAAREGPETKSPTAAAFGITLLTAGIAVLVMQAIDYGPMVVEADVQTTYVAATISGSESNRVTVLEGVHLSSLRIGGVKEFEWPETASCPRISNGVLQVAMATPATPVAATIQSLVTDTGTRLSLEIPRGRTTDAGKRRVKLSLTPRDSSSPGITTAVLAFGQGALVRSENGISEVSPSSCPGVTLKGSTSGMHLELSLDALARSGSLDAPISVVGDVTFYYQEPNRRSRDPSPWKSGVRSATFAWPALADRSVSVRPSRRIGVDAEKMDVAIGVEDAELSVSLVGTARDVRGAYGADHTVSYWPSVLEWAQTHVTLQSLWASGSMLAGLLLAARKRL